MPDSIDTSILYKIWTEGQPKDSVKNAYRHWGDHKSDFPEIKNAKEYVETAKRFADNPPNTAVSKIRSNGDTVIYDQPTDIFIILNKDGIPKTMYKPDPKIHKYKDNMEYFNAQK